MRTLSIHSIVTTRRGVLAFWAASILTRPLGASIGDLMFQKDHRYGVIGFGTTNASYIVPASILTLAAHLSITENDQTPPAPIQAELRGEPPVRAGSQA